MRIEKSSDASSLTSIYELSNRLRVVFPEIYGEFPDVDLDIFLVFRCLPDSIGRKTMRRYSKADNTLYLDMNFSEDQFKKMDIKEQEVAVADKLFSYLEESLKKYKFQGLDIEKFMLKFRAAAQSIGWGV